MKKKSKKWMSSIIVADTLGTVTLNGKIKRLLPPRGKYYREFEIEGEVDGTYGTKEWENGMINFTLDSFKGTDWSKVLDIHY